MDALDRLLDPPFAKDPPVKIDVPAKMLGLVLAILGAIAALFGLFGLLSLVGLGTFAALAGVGGNVLLFELGGIIGLIGTAVAAWGGYRMYQDDRDGKKLVIYGLAINVAGGLVSALGSLGSGLAGWIVGAAVAFVIYYLVIISRFEGEPKLV